MRIDTDLCRQFKGFHTVIRGKKIAADGERSVVVGSRGPILLALGVAVMATIGLGILPQAAFDLFDQTAMLLP